MNEFRHTQFGGAVNRTQLHVNHSRNAFFFGDAEVSFTLNDASMVDMQTVELPANAGRDAKSRFWKISLTGLRSGMNVLVAQVGPAGKVPLKRPLTINVVDEVTLPDANSDEGLFARLILHETETPSYPSYNLDDARKVMNYIRIAVDNRRFRRPDIFGFQPTPVPTPLKVITATTVVHHKHGPASVLRQFEGLSTYPNLQPKDTKNFEECVRLANDDANAQQPAFAAHVQAALDVANAKQAQPDPSKNGLYGWMTEGSGPPGKFQVAYASLLGITFYTITDEAATPPSAVHAHRAAQPKPR